MNDKKISIEKSVSSVGATLSMLLIIFKTFALISAFSHINVVLFSVNVPLVVITIIKLCFLVPCLALSIKMYINVMLKRNSSKALTVWLLVISAILTVLNITDIYFAGFFGVLWPLIFAAFTAACCILLRIGFQPNPQPQEQLYQLQQDSQSSPHPLTIEEKIAELKRLKELYVISDEQYDNAVEKLIHDAIHS